MTQSARKICVGIVVSVGVFIGGYFSVRPVEAATLYSQTAYDSFITFDYGYSCTQANLTGMTGTAKTVRLLVSAGSGGCTVDGTDYIYVRSSDYLCAIGSGVEFYAVPQTIAEGATAEMVFTSATGKSLSGTILIGSGSLNAEAHDHCYFAYKASNVYNGGMNCIHPWHDYDSYFKFEDSETTYCGNAVCDSGEDVFNCEDDCEAELPIIEKPTASQYYKPGTLPEVLIRFPYLYQDYQNIDGTITVMVDRYYSVATEAPTWHGVYLSNDDADSFYIDDTDLYRAYNAYLSLPMLDGDHYRIYADGVYTNVSTSETFISDDTAKVEFFVSSTTAGGGGSSYGEFVCPEGTYRWVCETFKFLFVPTKQQIQDVFDQFQEDVETEFPFSLVYSGDNTFQDAFAVGEAYDTETTFTILNNKEVDIPKIMRDTAVGMNGWEWFETIFNACCWFAFGWYVWARTRSWVAPQQGKLL